MHNWEEILKSMDSEQCFNAITEILTSICKEHVPPKISKKKPPNVFRRERRVLLRRHSRVCSRLQDILIKPTVKFKLDSELISLDRQLLVSHTQEHTFLENQAVSRIKTDPKFFFKYASKQSKLLREIGPFLDANGESISNRQHICQRLQDQYLSVFSPPSALHTINDITCFFTSNNNHTDPKLEFINISPSDVLASISVKVQQLCQSIRAVICLLQQITVLCHLHQ